ncbi:MAG: hypothetical protein ACE5FL_03630 [Myxococcota bacterium]
MKSTIAMRELYGAPPGGERRRLTLAVATPVRNGSSGGWSCKLVISDVVPPVSVDGADSLTALAGALRRMRDELVALGDRGWEFSLDAAGGNVIDPKGWLAPPD